MEHDFTKIDDAHDEYGILLQGEKDEAKFARVFNSALLSTHQLKFYEGVVSDGEVRRKKIRVLLEPLGFDEIKYRSHDFADLSTFELRNLIERYGVTVKPTEGRPAPGADKLAMVEALREFTPKPEPEKESSKPRDVMIIPAEIEAMDHANLLTKAGMLGVKTKGPAGKEASDEELKRRIAKKMAESEAVANV